MKPPIMILTALLLTLTSVSAETDGVETLEDCGLRPSENPQRAARPDEAFNALFTRYGDGWTGGDSTYSVLLPDGRTLWIFSDTFLGTVNPDRSRSSRTRLINNSFVLQDGHTLTTLHGGTESAPEALFIPTTDDPSWYWMYDATVEDDRLQVFLIKFLRFGSGMWDWRWLETHLASLSLPDLELQSITPVESENGVAYGAALLEGNDYTYIYGVEDQGDIKYLHLARAVRSNLHGPWEFFREGAWSGDPTSSSRMMRGVANEFSVTQLGGGYVMVTMDTRQRFGGDIVAYYACSPEGPWSGPNLLYTTPETGGNIFTYNAHAHPQFSQGGELLISYNVNSFEFQDVFTNADNYRPRFIRVPVVEVSEE